MQAYYKDRIAKLKSKPRMSNEIENLVSIEGTFEYSQGSTVRRIKRKAIKAYAYWKRRWVLLDNF